MTLSARYILGNLIQKADRLGLTRRKVSVFVGGAQRCGTTTLHAHLEKHPEIIAGTRKEIGFFHRDPAYDLGRNWYHSHFPSRWRTPKSARALDATPDYLLAREAPARIFQYNPSAKIIFSFRNPVDRAFSQWNLCKRLIEARHEALIDQMSLSSEVMRRCFLPLIEAGECPSFPSMVDQELKCLLTGAEEEVPFPDFVRRGLYAKQVRNWLSFFDPSQILLLSFDEFKRDPLETLNRIAEFLDIGSFNEIYAATNANPEAYRDSMDGEVRERLLEFYASDMEEFQELAGFGWRNQVNDRV